MWSYVLFAQKEIERFFIWFVYDPLSFLHWKKFANFFHFEIESETCVTSAFLLTKLLHYYFYLFDWAWIMHLFFFLQFFLAPTVAERLETETNEEVQKEMLKQLTKKLPVQTRTISGCRCSQCCYFVSVFCVLDCCSQNLSL